MYVKFNLNYYNLLSLLLFISIFLIYRIINHYSFQTEIIKIKNSFRDTYNKYMNCIENDCLINCISKNVNRIRWKNFSEKDIPGPYPYNYPLIKDSNNICKNNTNIFISIITPCSELEERMAIRIIYKNRYPFIQFHFFIGLTTEKCYNIYKQEKNMFHDISQIPIQESFANETIFTMYLHKILPIICPTALYYGKMDADMYINFNKLKDILKKNKEKYNLIYVCKVWNLITIDVNQENKYSSPKLIEDYYKQALPKKGIPCFTGCFTLWPKYLSHELYKESIYERNLIRMDDQHVAWLIYKLNRRYFNITYYDLRCLNVLKERNIICKYPINNVIAYHQLKGKHLYAFSKLVTLI